MKLIDIIRYYLMHIKNAYRQRKILYGNKYNSDRTAYNIIRLTHSVEKGLSIEKPRLGYGEAKQNELMELICKLKNSKNKLHMEAIRMGVDALNEYLIYHDKMKFQNSHTQKIRIFLKDYVCSDPEYVAGGVYHLCKSDMNFNVSEIEKLFKTRHSIRIFDDSDIDDDKIEKAVKLAQTCPSACNRQGVRVYGIKPEKADFFKEWMTGTGGFEKNIKEFILITAKLSAYRDNEPYQYIVSASIFAAYLSLTLHAYGLGACIVQRPVIWNEAWERVRLKMKIDEDEQAICILGVGNLKKDFDVPVSHRLDEDIVFTEL